MQDLELILQCPISKQPLKWLSSDELDTLNAAIANGKIITADGSNEVVPFSGAFQVQGKQRFYLVRQGVVCLLPDLALIAQNEARPNPKSETKQILQDFYNEYGWEQQAGHYRDAIDSEDLREVSQNYIASCHKKVKQYLPAKAKYLLDIASGPIQYNDYLSYSQDYDFRICADISFSALLAAKKKLNNKGVYILCDITQLPFLSDAIDAIVSLHTIYHVPKEEQKTAFYELYRVLKPKGKAVVVYSLGRNALLMNLLLFPYKLLTKIRALFSSSSGQGAIYFHAFSYSWLKQNLQQPLKVRIYSWRSVSVPFLKIYIHKYLFGKSILKFVLWLETKFPNFMAKVGAYPMLVISK